MILDIDQIFFQIRCEIKNFKGIPLVFPGTMVGLEQILKINDISKQIVVCFRHDILFD